MAKCNQLTRLPFKGLIVNTIFHPFGDFTKLTIRVRLVTTMKWLDFGVKMSKIKCQGHEQTKYWQKSTFGSVCHHRTLTL